MLHISLKLMHYLAVYLCYYLLPVRVRSFQVRMFVCVSIAVQNTK